MTLNDWEKAARQFVGRNVAHEASVISMTVAQLRYLLAKIDAKAPPCTCGKRKTAAKRGTIE